MNEVTKAIEIVRSSVERVGKSGRDTVYLDNVSFRASVTKFQAPEGANVAEAREDFRWFMMCEDTWEPIPHPCPERSWWLRQFGKDALPYGMTWNLQEVEDALTTPRLERRAVLFNPLTPTPACILCYQFQVIDHTTGGPHLDVTVTMRSSDVVNCLPQDAVMTELLLHHLAERLDMIPGRMTFNIANAHIYWEDLDTWDEGVIDMPL
jgi:hypothetical protein